MTFKRIAFVLLLLASISTLTSAQSTSVQRTSTAITGDANYPAPIEARLNSKLMGREMPYRVILPVEYGANSSKRFPVIYLLHGLMGHFNNWTDLTGLARFGRQHHAIIVTPEGGDGWYTDSASSANDRYESYIIGELIPEIDAKYRTDKRREARGIAGLSMGGYGALKFGLKYPQMFSLAGSFSGALGAASITEKQFPGAIGKTIDSIFGPAESETRKSNDIFAITRALSPEAVKTLPFIYLDCGTEDFLFDNNREFVSLLIERIVPHEYRQLPGAHEWKYWNQQVQEFLRLAEKSFAGK